MTTNPNFLPFALPDVGDEELSAVMAVMQSGWLTTGPKAREFESDFSMLLGGGVEAIAVNSATAGLHLGLDALGVSPGDEVITTTHTFTSTAEVIRYMGADPVFVDVDKETLCIDVDAVERAITRRTKVIIPVHFAGKAAEMDRLISIANAHGVKVMEDAAHALPTTYNGRLIGTLDSDVTVFSFYANKTMTTGEGGMLVTRNKDVAKRAKQMRLHGISRDAFDRFTSNKPSWYYEVIAPGFKYNLTDIAASIGIQQIKKIESFQKRREEIAFQYNEAFKNLPVTLPAMPMNTDKHSWHLYVLQLHDSLVISRDRFIELMYENSVGCSVHYIPLHLHPYWRETYNLTPEMFPVSQHAYEQSVSLPIYSKMKMEDVERVVTAVKTILTNG
jgi:dTDP-4-amino-4,6-dideoxygalactose transaminase